MSKVVRRPVEREVRKIEKTTKRDRRPAITGCTLPIDARAAFCTGLTCDNCGWYEDEAARRKAMIRRGIWSVNADGLRYLYVGSIRRRRIDRV